MLGKMAMIGWWNGHTVVETIGLIKEFLARMKGHKDEELLCEEIKSNEDSNS
jgi:hypothetical protein